MREGEGGGRVGGGTCSEREGRGGILTHTLFLSIFGKALPHCCTGTMSHPSA